VSHNADRRRAGHEGTVEPRKPNEYRNRTNPLRGSEIQTMTDVGKFRIVDEKDLREFAYGGDSKHLKAHLTNLRRQGLIVEREIPHQETAPRRLVALTKQGHRLLVATNNTPKDQALYHGFTKLREPITTRTSIVCTREDSKRLPAREAQTSGSFLTQS